MNPPLPWIARSGESPNAAPPVWKVQYCPACNVLPGHDGEQLNQLLDGGGVVPTVTKPSVLLVPAQCDTETSCHPSEGATDLPRARTPPMLSIDLKLDACLHFGRHARGHDAQFLGKVDWFAGGIFHTFEAPHLSLKDGLGRIAHVTACQLLSAPLR